MQMGCASDGAAKLTNFWGGLLEVRLAEGVPMEVAAEATYAEALEACKPEGGAERVCLPQCRHSLVECPCRWPASEKVVPDEGSGRVTLWARVCSLGPRENYLGRLRAISRAFSAKESSITIGVNSPYFFITAFSIRKSAIAGFLGSSDP